MKGKFFDARIGDIGPCHQRVSEYLHKPWGAVRVSVGKRHSANEGTV